MSIADHHQPAPASPGGARAVWSGLAALLTLVLLVAALSGAATWAAVQLLRAVA